MATSLLHKKNPLANPVYQLRILQNPDRTGVQSFEACLQDAGIGKLRASSIQVLQLNLGKVCNQSCAHCHVDAAPDRRESMPRETAEACIRALRSTNIPTLDLTGGAPELNPNFRWLVTEARGLGRRVIDRCNLTILTVNGFEDLPDFLADQQVEIVASLPCYLEENCDRQRGEGVFHKSISVLQHLNALGYGKAESKLVLTLVYNPLGPSLPPTQPDLETAYRKELRGRYGIEFNRLFTITNMPISRFLDDLLRTGQYERYMEKLVGAFNPATVEHLMCRTTLSVDWQGRLYDCDFNQMLELPLSKNAPQHIGDFDFATLEHRPIVTGQHCFGCTAGHGSSCQGTLIS